MPGGISLEAGSLTIGHGDSPEAQTTIRPGQEGFTAVIFDRASGHFGLGSKHKSLIEIPTVATGEELTTLLSHLPSETIGIIEAFIKGEDVGPLIETGVGHE